MAAITRQGLCNTNGRYNNTYYAIQMEYMEDIPRPELYNTNGSYNKIRTKYMQYNARYTKTWTIQYKWKL